MSDYEIFTQALSGSGCWSGWDEDLPRAFQIEFDGVKLWIPFPDDVDRPSHHVALRFKDVISVAFLTRKNISTKLPLHWPLLLKERKLEETLWVDPHDFIFTDINGMKKILENSEIDVHYGVHPLEKTFFDAKVKLVFWANGKGMAIAADDMCLVDFVGEIPLDMVERLRKDWWDYWREYWDAKSTPTPWRKDLLCETVVPKDHV